jgi:hypothetical protein
VKNFIVHHAHVPAMMASNGFSCQAMAPHPLAIFMACGFRM